MGTSGAINLKTIEPHPFANFLPLMNEREFESLKQDVLAKGAFEEPVRIYQGKLLDGRNRRRAHLDTGIPLKFEAFEGSSADAVRYVYSRANRRNMDESQKAAAAVNFLPHFAAEALNRKLSGVGRNGDHVEPGSTRSDAVSKPKLISGKSRAQHRARLNQVGEKELEYQRELHAMMCPRDASRNEKIRMILDRMFGPEEGKLYPGCDTAEKLRHKLRTLDRLNLFLHFRRDVLDDPAAKDGSGRSHVLMIDKLVEKHFPKQSPAAGARGKSRDFAGSLFGVSGRYVQDAKLVKESSPKLFEQILAGTIKVSVAKRQIHNAARVKQSRQLARRVINPSDCQFITGDAIAQMKRLPRRKFRFIFADPPYNLGFTYLDDPTRDRLPVRQYIQWTYAWTREAAELLTGDGAICVMIPEEWVAACFMALADAGLKMRRLIGWHESFGQAGNKNFGRTLRYIWYFVRDPANCVFDGGSILTDSKRSTIYADKRAMPGGKVPDALWDFSRVAGTFSERIPDKGIPTQLPVALVERAIRCFTEIGDEVLDPFGGTGTTARAALKLARKATLIERSPRYIKIAQRELAAVAINGKE